jgi:hypothetical protein
MGLCQGRSASGSCRSTNGPDAVDDSCTTWCVNTHRTKVAEEREVLYLWHPWAGHIVHIHEAIEKADGTVLRCSQDGGARGHWLELPAWMFDRAMCLSMRIARDPRVELAALAALRELLTEAASPHRRSLSSKTPVLSAARKTRDQNRGKTHATPKATSRGPSQTSPSARSIRSADGGGMRSAGAVVASAAGRDTPSRHGAHGSAPRRSRPHLSPSDPDRGSR